MFQNRNVSLWKRKFTWDIALCFWILLNPFLLYFHKAFGDGRNIIIFGQEYYHGFNSNEIFVWFVLVKVVAMQLLLTWFLTTSYGWRHFVFFPFAVYFYTFVKALDFISLSKSVVVPFSSLV